MYQNWLNMEHFYYYQFSWMIIIAIVLAVIVVSIILYIDRKGIKIIVGLILTAIIGMGIYSWSQYQKHEQMIQQASMINPAVRSLKRKSFFIDEYYLSSEIQIYREAYYQPLFEDLMMYEEYQYQEPIEYLGQRGIGSYYIQIDDDVYAVGSTNIDFTDDVDSPQRIGVQYALVDDNFTDIGFLDHTPVYLITYQIPKSMENLVIEESSPRTGHHQGIIHQWIIPGS